MKKLMTMLATAAAAFGLYAAEPVDPGFVAGTAFEAEDGGNSYDGDFVEGFWTIPEGETAVVAEDHGVQKANRPTMFNDVDKTQVLKIKTTFGQPVVHNVKSTGGSLDIDTGLYFDGLVNMTACDEAPNMELYEDTKIAVYIQEILDETTEEVTGTNFVVVAKPTAAVEDGRFVCAKASLPDDLSGWHRLTIKAIADIGTGKTGFVVFVDGTPVECIPAKLDATGLTPAAQEWNKDGMLFVSLVDGDATIKSVAFDGQGSVDELVFTTTAPDFAKDAEFATVAWTPENVTSVTINGTVLDAAELALGTYDAKLDSNGQFTIAWIGSATKTDSDTQTVDAADLTDNTFNIDEEIEDVVALVGTAKYDDLDKAVAYANQATEAVVLKLIAAEETDVVAVNNAFVTIDLNGQTIAELGDSGDGVEYAKMTITNSSEALATVDGGIWAENVEFTATNIRFSYEYNVDENDETKPIFATTVPEGYEVKPDANEEYFEIVKPVVKYGTVIFVCDAAGVNVQVDNLVVGEVVPAEKIPASVKGYMKITGWDQDLTTWPVVEGSTTITGTADLNLTKDGEVYQITEVADLVTLQAAVADGYATAGKTFKQTADINMEGAGLWKCIGDKGAKTPFSGTYDGNGKRIYNVTFDAQAANSNSYMGFFWSVVDATIKDLTVHTLGFGNLPTDGFGGDAYEYGGAVIVGKAYNSTLTGLTAEGSLGTDADPLTHNGGGICANLIGGTISYCTNKASIVCAYTKTAGICVFTSSNVVDTIENRIEYCVNEGALKGVTAYVKDGEKSTKDTEGAKVYKTPASDGYAGIVAWVGSPSANGAYTVVNYCENTGVITTDVSGADHVGGFVGEIAGEVAYGLKGTNNIGRAGMPLIGTINSTASNAADFHYTADGVQPVTLAADGTFVIEVAHEKKGYSQGKVAPVLALASGETVTFITNKCTYVVNFAGITVTDGSQDEIKEEVVAGGVKFTAVALPPPGPTPVDDGKVEPDPEDPTGKTFVVTPADGKDSIEITGADSSMTIKVTSAADFVISGLNGATVKVMCNGVDIAGVCLGGAEGNFSTALNPEKTTPTFTESASGEEPLVIGENVGVTVTSVEGLAYTLVRGEEVGTIATDIQTVKGTGEAITLEDANKPAGKAFYKVSVSKAEVK